MKPKNQLKSLRLGIFLIYTLLLNTGCNHQKEQVFIDLENIKFNVFDIRETSCSYKQSGIYKIKNYQIGNNYLHNTNFLLVDNLKVYKILTTLELPRNENDFLNDKKLILDFGLNVKDSIEKKPGELILAHKIYDSHVNDSIFIFSRKFIWNTDITNIVASKKYGIMGIYDYHYLNKKNKEIFKYYGHTYFWLLDDSYTISRYKPQKQLRAQKVSIKLSTLGFLNCK